MSLRIENQTIDNWDSVILNFKDKVKVSIINTEIPLNQIIPIFQSVCENNVKELELINNYRQGQSRGQSQGRIVMNDYIWRFRQGFRYLNMYDNLNSLVITDNFFEVSDLCTYLHNTRELKTLVVQNAFKKYDYAFWTYLKLNKSLIHFGYLYPDKNEKTLMKQAIKRQGLIEQVCIS